MLIFFLFIINTHTILNEIVLDGYYNQVMGTIYIKGGLGTPYQELYFTIDIESNVNYVLENDTNYENLKSSTFRKTNEYVEYSKELYGYTSYDFFSLDRQHYLTHFKFLLNQYNAPDVYTPFLGLGMGDGSVIDQLFKAKIINKTIFGFAKRKIVLDREINERNYRIIKAKEDNVKYIGVLSNIIFEDEVKIKEDKDKNIIEIRTYKREIEFNDIDVVFSSTKGLIILPLKYLDIFINKYFGKKVFEKKCVMIKRYMGYFIQCDKKIIKYFPNVYLVFKDNVIVKLTYFDLYEEPAPYSPKYTFCIFFEEIENVVIGIKYLNRLEIFFNEEEKYIAFGNEKSFNLKISSRNVLIMFVSLINSLFMICAILFIIFVNKLR